MPARKLIVTFHGIGAPPAHVPEPERPYWATVAEFARVVSEGLAAARARGLTPVFTFDDGNRSDLDIAAPLLRDHGATGIFFPCSGRIGAPGYLGVGDIRALQAEGFEIGSHGINHVPWGRLDPATLKAEVEQSKRALEDLTGRAITAAALPFGSYNRRVLAALRQAGYAAVYASDPGLPRSDAWFRQRFSYRADRPCVPAELADRAASLPRRVTTALKGRLKALR